MILRPYQLRAIERLAELARKHAHLLLVIPTGGGKTLTASAIVSSARDQFNARVLFVAHRVELIDQAVRAIGRADVGVIRADDERTNALMPVQVASIQTLARRGLPPADIIIIDEAHRAAADSYAPLFKTGATVIGLTATPCRADGKPLGDLFGALEVVTSYSELIAEGFIAEPVVYSTPQRVDLSGVRTVGGDYDVGQLEAVMLGQGIVGNLVESYQRHADGRKTVVFAVSVNHSKAIVARFAEAGIRCEHVDGTTDEETRAGVAERLRTGDTQVVSNVGIYGEGWDEPSVKCLIIARPTKSLSLWMQMAGRSLRPWCPCHGSGARTESGDRCVNAVQPVILDMGGNVDRHGLPHEDREWSLEGKPKRKSEAKYKTCPKCFAYIASSCRKCPQCGLDFVEVIEPKPLPKEFDMALLRRTKSPDEKRSEFERLWAIARAKGHKPGYAAALFKEKFGEWPPWSWSQEVKEDFARDATWQARLAAKEEWKKRNAEPAPAEVEPVESAPVDELERDEPAGDGGLSDWLGEMGIGS